MIGPDGKWGIWPLDGTGLRPIPGLDSKYFVADWSPDGTSLYVLSSQTREGAAKVYRVNVATGKWSFGKPLARTSRLGSPALAGLAFPATETPTLMSTRSYCRKPTQYKGLK